MDLEELAKEIGTVLQEKHEQYGGDSGADSCEAAGEILKVLYPDGVSVDQYQDMLLLVRIFDKLFRIANGNMGEESAWMDLGGYALRGEFLHRKKAETTREAVTIMEHPLYIRVLDAKCMPHRSHANDAGLDLRARIPETIEIPPGRVVKVPAGIKVAIPADWVGDVRPRSGMIARRNIDIKHGTIDPGYRGEIHVLAHNINPAKAEGIDPYERIAQLVVVKCTRHTIFSGEGVEYESHWPGDDTERGEGGFGSTGTE